MSIGPAVREWRDVDRVRFETEIVPSGEPAVLRGLVAHWPAVAAGRESPHALARYLDAAGSDKPLPTYVGSPAIGGRFFYRDDMRGLNFDQGSAPLRNVLSQLLADLPEGKGPAIYSGAAAAADHFPRFPAENPMPLIDAAVMPRLWVGNAVTISTHYDVANNIACVAAGNRRFTLFPPEQVANLYVGPLENTISGQPVSMVDPLAPDLARFPRLEQALATMRSVDLAPGDAIYVPSLWWHHVQSTDRFNLLVNYWWSEPSDGSAFECLIHGLLAIRDLPPRERDAWRAFFDHFVFEHDEETVAHLPEHARGILGARTPARAGLIREFLMRGLTRRS